MKDLTKIPDPAKHKKISFVKSGLRILAGGSLVGTAFFPFHYDLLVASSGVLFILAELLGIAEEMV